MKKNSTITIILSTYNRPDTLRIAIQSVLYQTYSNWILLVIGDHCDERTEEVVSKFNDVRIHYINLPVRAGEQSGPNSVGIAIANTEFLAFLNHDDVWLKDHLDYSLKTLRQNDADFFVGKCAFTSDSIEIGQGQRKPVFDSVQGDSRHPNQTFTRSQLRTFEPASSWLLKTEAAKKVGYWQGRDQVLDVFPIQDWVRRAWRLNLKFVFGTRISVLYILTHNRPVHSADKGIYNYQSSEHVYLLSVAERLDPDDLRQIVLREVEAGKKSKGLIIKRLIQKAFNRPKVDPVVAWILMITRPLRVVLRVLFTPLIRWLYYRYGIDIRGFLFKNFYRLIRIQNNSSLLYTVKRRTGETLNKKYDIDTIVQITLESHPNY